MSRRKNSFSKAIGHLKSTKIDEKLEVLHEIPTNNTSGLYTVVPGTVTRTDNFGKVPDHSTIDWDIDGGDGKDTSGLFDGAGNHKFISPPGDNSYILGPMSSMYYTYASPNVWTMIGYIRESDRRMVNLGDIDGTLEDWDGVSNFTSYGQLTIEQARWFRDTAKKPDGYRAFYPGPPSSTPDAFGRYYCTITGTPLAQKDDLRDTSPMDLQGSDNFSALLDKLKNQAGKIDWDKVEKGFNLGMLAWDVVAVLGILFPEPGTSIAGAARLATRLAGLKGIKQSLRNRFLRGALNPLGQRTVRSGAAGRVRQAVYSGRPYQGTRGFGKTTYGTTNISTGRTYTNPGALKGLRGTGGRTNPRGTLDRGTLPQRYIDKYGSRSVTGQQQIKLGKKAAQRVFGTNSYEIDGNLLFEGKMDSQIEKFIEFLQQPGQEDKLNIFFEKLLDHIDNVSANEYDGDPRNLHPDNPINSEEDPWALKEEKKIRILKTLKDPVVIPETRQKSYKVKPGRRNKKDKTNFQGMDKLVGDVTPQKSFKKPQDLWSDGWQGHNARVSQDKKNIVLEKIGQGKQAWNYMLNHSQIMNADQLEKFWGKNPDFYSYFFDGKKYRPVRKEQVKGDYLVFLVDENGKTSNMLQSELNLKLSEARHKKMLAEYEYTKPEPIPYEDDPLVKKVAKRLKDKIDYPDKPAVKGYPNEPPPKMVKGFHPDFGKKYKYDKLDPVSAVAMRNAPTGDPEIDANVEKASRKLKIKEQYSNWISDWRKDLLDEGMTTQMLTGILPSTGNTDLEVLQTGLTGEGDIDYGEPGLGDEAMEGEGQYTWVSNLDILDNVDEPNNTGTLIRIFDQDSKEFRNQLHGGGEHGYLLAIPGYQRGMLRNVKPTGDYNAYDKSYRTNKGLPLKQNGTDLYYHIYGQTNDELGKGYGSWNSNDGLLDSGMGVVLNFDGPGSPRYVALKSVDSTEFDTIKIHAAVASNSMVSDYRDSDGVLRDKKVQVYYWAGDHDDYVRHSSASNIYDGSKTVSGDGWRPINMKPNGELDNTVDPYIIKHAADREMNGVDANGVAYSASNKLHGYSVPLPEYTRSKNARYIIIQTDKNNNSDDNRFALASVRFQRKNTLRVPSISKPLTDLEAAPFIRVGQGVNQDAEQRKKRVIDMIKASLKYGNMRFGKGMYNSSNLAENKKFKSWRKDLAESDWSPVTSTIANRATQTFQHISGTTATFAGLGGVEVHPSTTVITGETVSTPTYNDLALAGYAKPLGGILKKQNSVKRKEINSRLDSSEKFAKKVKADKFMKARVDPTTPGIMQQDQEKAMNEKLYAFQKKQSAVDQKNTKIQLDHSKTISDYIENLFKGKNKINPIELYKKKALKTATGAIAIENEGGKTKVIVLTGRVKLVPSTSKPGEFGAGYYGDTDIDIEVFEEPKLHKVPKMPKDLQNWAAQYINPSYTPKGGKLNLPQVIFTRAAATAVVQKSSSVGVEVSGAFNVLNYYIDNFVKQGGRYVPEIRDKSHNLTHLYSNKTKDILQKGMDKLKPKIDEKIKLGKLVNQSNADLQKEIRDLVDNYFAHGGGGDSSRDIYNSLGNALGFNLDVYQKTGNYQFDSTYEFTSTLDMGIRGKLSFLSNVSQKYVSGQLDGDSSEAVQNPMKFTVNISAGKPTAPSKGDTSSDDKTPLPNAPDNYDWRKDAVVRKKKVTKDT